jgi:hypothetical protein
MWKRAVVIAGTGVAWGVAAADLFSVLPTAIDDSLSRFALAVAVCGTGRLMLWCHQRPIAEAFDFGYDKGRRDQMRESNARSVVTPIRRASQGLTDFNRSYGRRVNGHKIDA